jgi:hypothetical protein
MDHGSGQEELDLVETRSPAVRRKTMGAETTSAPFLLRSRCVDWLCTVEPPTARAKTGRFASADLVEHP